MNSIVQRRRVRQSLLSDPPDLMPLVDMVFILLIFFILSSTFLKPVIHLSLPSAVIQDTPKDTLPIVISIDSLGTLYVNQKFVEPETLHSTLSQLNSATNPEDVEILFSADKSVDYGLFIYVIDTLKQLNIESISLEHE